MIFLTDKYYSANLFHYGSVKYRLVLISVLGAKPLALADAFDAIIFLQHALKSILKTLFKITLPTVVAKLFNIMIRNAENGLMNDNKTAREAYNDEVFHDIIWIRKYFNLAPATKKAINSELLKTNNTR